MTDQTPAAGVDPAPAASAEETVKAGAADSLLDGDGPAAEPEKKEEPAAADPTWFYADGVPGKGEAPEWFKADKYKTAEAQAQAYVELEKRFGAFAGAPKTGKYETPKVPEGLEGEFYADHPIFDKFSKWALDRQVSQEGYNEVLGLFAEYEAARVPDRSEILRDIGEGAESRLAAIKQWANANLTADEYGLLKVALAPGEHTAAAVKALEKVIAKTRVVAPKAGADVQAGTMTRESIAELQGKRGPDGKRLYDTDSKYREKIEKMWIEYAEKQAA